MLSTHLTRRLGLGAAAAALALGVAACGSSTSSSPTSSSSASSSSSSRPIIAAADPSLFPYNFYKSGSTTFQGINIDIANALSKQIGRPIEFKSAPFDSIIPGLQAGRYDIAMTGMFDTKEREKVVKFVDYLADDNNFLLRSDDSKTVTSFADLCGVAVGLPKGALEISLAQRQDKTCKKDGKPNIDLKVFPDLNSTALALLDDRVDVAPNDSASNAYLIKNHPGKLRATGSYLAEGYFAIGLPKDSSLSGPIQKGMQALLADGTLKKILTTWGIPNRTPSAIHVNDAAF